MFRETFNMNPVDVTRLVPEPKSEEVFSLSRDKFDDKYDEALAVETAMKQLDQRVNAVVMKSCEVSILQQSLAKALVSLSSVEDDSDARDALVQMGKLLQRAGSATGVYAQADHIRFEQPLVELRSMSSSIREAFDNRRKVKAVYIEEYEDLIRRKDELNSSANANFDSAGGTSAVDFIRLSNTARDMEDEYTGLEEKKANIIDASEGLLKDFEETKFATGCELRDVCSSFVDRRVSTQSSHDVLLYSVMLLCHRWRRLLS
jgi:hypothetical protein